MLAWTRKRVDRADSRDVNSRFSYSTIVSDKSRHGQLLSMYCKLVHKYALQREPRFPSMLSLFGLLVSCYSNSRIL